MKKHASTDTDSRLKRASKVHFIPFDLMKVSPVSQRKFRKSQADKIAANMDLDALGYPVVSRYDGAFWIVDGQHRIAALKKWDPTLTGLDCEVYDNLNEAEMASLFDLRDERRKIATFEKFRVRVVAERPRESAILRVVEANDLNISLERGERSIAAVSALGRVYDSTGDVVLGQALRAIRDSYPGIESAFDSVNIQGFGLLFARYNGTIDQRHLTNRLANTKGGLTALRQRGHVEHKRTGQTLATCLAAAIVDCYNAGRPKKKLTPWWKTDGGDPGIKKRASGHE